MTNYSEIDILGIKLDQTFSKSLIYGPYLSEGPYHGHSLMDTLKDIDSYQATLRPLENRHNIWEIVNHCRYWMDETSKAIQGQKLTSVFRYEDWPPIDSSEEEWISAIEIIENSYSRLKLSILKLNNDQPNEIIECGFHGSIFRFTLRKMLYGVIDHNLYHAGQISLLQKSNNT
ncbi:hypothetical protein GF319_04085 [Candidatus Bathyarchaeota archaeon]|nr:hypothetical protein [Candidatus Bathyarchaeota archaeon]